jgi:hypothetical protein
VGDSFSTNQHAYQNNGIRMLMMKEKIYTLTDEGPSEKTENPLTQEERIEALLHDGTRLVLKHLGLDLSGNIDRQLEERQIILEDCRQERNPLCRGVYILQKQDRAVLPIAFVGNISAGGEKIQTDIVMFTGEELKD